MITLIHEKNNTLSLENSKYQSVYDDYINNEINFYNLICSCGNSNCLTRHGHYERTIITCNGTFQLKTLRVKCSFCERTHAIMFPCIVPYSQVLLRQHVEIIKTPLKELENLMIEYDIDESRIRYIKKQFKTYWKRLLKTSKIIIDDTITISCFHHIGKQFMQVRNTKNICFIMSG